MVTQDEPQSVEELYLLTYKEAAIETWVAHTGQATSSRADPDASHHNAIDGLVYDHGQVCTGEGNA